jgi:hypothetical protein
LPSPMFNEEGHACPATLRTLPRRVACVQTSSRRSLLEFLRPLPSIRSAPRPGTPRAVSQALPKYPARFDGQILRIAPCVRQRPESFPYVQPRNLWDACQAILTPAPNLGMRWPFAPHFHCAQIHSRVDRHALDRAVCIEHGFGQRRMRVNGEHQLIDRPFQLHRHHCL